MKATLVWHTPDPEKTIALAMRRCYSTKPIEDIISELEQKGPEYWKYLITRALQDKSLDVLEHYCLEFLVEDLDEQVVRKILCSYPFAKFLQLKERDWLLSMNARTLLEIWHDDEFHHFALEIVRELDARSVGKIFNLAAFGEASHAS